MGRASSMTTGGAVASGLVLAALAGACSRAPKPNADTVVAAATDSARVAPPSSPATTSPAATPPATTPPAATPVTPSPTPTPSETVMTGTVAVSGVAADQITSLRVEGGSPVTLVGPLEGELRTLGGATIWAAGAPGPGKPNATFLVSRYDIVSIGGARPVVGIVVAGANGPLLATERDTLRLVSAPPQLAAKTGAKVWVVGRRTGTDLTPQTYGILREP